MRLHHLPAVIALLCCVACAQPRVHTRFSATLPDTRLAPLSDSVLPAYPMRDDHGVTLGGLGSDLFHSPGSPADDVWAVTDRGPNSVVKVRGKSRSTLVVPDFTPLLVHLQVNTMGVTLREVIPITDPTGRPVTGRPNNPDRDPQFWDATGHTKLAFDENGLDIEGMIRLRNGEFWVAEEYAPSLVHLDAAGHVLARYVPAGVSLPHATYPVIPALPAVYRHRNTNRGFEGLAISTDEQTLYAVLQSPLLPPQTRDPERTRTTRILAFDRISAQTTGDYVYMMADVRDFDPRPDTTQSDMKLAAVLARADSSLLVLERTDRHCVVQQVDLTTATNLNGTPWQDAYPPAALETSRDLAEHSITPAHIQTLLDCAAISGVPDKIEGMTLLDETTLLLANDNDFAIGAVTASGAVRDNGVKTIFLAIELPARQSNP